MPGDFVVQQAPLNLEEICRIGLVSFGRTKGIFDETPPGIRREILIPFLSYRIQENAYGGLKPSVRTELRRIAESLKANPSGLRGRSRIKPGSRILRRWRGEMHEVIAEESGFKYRGASYQSLSQIARRVTGTRWSGPAFFGLKTTKSNGCHDSA